MQRCSGLSYPGRKATPPAASSQKGLFSWLHWELPRTVTIPQNAQWPASVWNTVGARCMDYRQRILNFPMPFILARLLAPGCTGKVLTEVTHPLPSLAWPNSTGTSHLCHLYAHLPSRWEQLWDEAQGSSSLYPQCLPQAGAWEELEKHLLHGWMTFQTGKASTCPHLLFFSSLG